MPEWGDTQRGLTFLKGEGRRDYVREEGSYDRDVVNYLIKGLKNNTTRTEEMNGDTGGSSRGSRAIPSTLMEAHNCNSSPNPMPFASLSGNVMVHHIRKILRKVTFLFHFLYFPQQQLS